MNLVNNPRYSILREFKSSHFFRKFFPCLISRLLRKFEKKFEKIVFKSQKLRIYNYFASNYQCDVFFTRYVQKSQEIESCCLFCSLVFNLRLARVLQPRYFTFFSLKNLLKKQISSAYFIVLPNYSYTYSVKIYSLLQKTNITAWILARKQFYFANCKI